MPDNPCQITKGRPDGQPSGQPERQDDDAAFMELVTSNNQGELSPLEIGIHALKAVPKSEGGRGKKGGLSEYAKRVGKDKGNLTRYRNGAEVYESVKNCCNDTTVYIDRVQHLSAIHKLPRPCWKAACEWLAENEASVADVEAKVKAAARLRNHSSQRPPNE